MLCAGDTLLALGPIFPEVGQASGYLRFMTERHARIYIYIYVHVMLEVVRAIPALVHVVRVTL